MKRDIFEQYAKLVSNFFGITLDELFTKFNGRTNTSARQMLWWLCAKRHIPVMQIHKHTEMSGLKMAHSSIVHGINVFEQKVQQDDDYNKIITQFENSVTLKLN
jgi:chromosomal replication initiation ATPase DnaA